MSNTAQPKASQDEFNASIEANLLILLYRAHRHKGETLENWLWRSLSPLDAVDVPREDWLYWQSITAHVTLNATPTFRSLLTEGETE